MVFIYLQKGQRRKKNKKTIDLLGEQGVNWSAITKQRQASTHKEWEEVGRQMDWVTTGHKGEAGTKWTVPIMLRLLRGNKSQRKTHLKALLPSSLIPAGGLGSTKPLAKCAWDGGGGWRYNADQNSGVKCSQTEKKVSIAYAAVVAFNGTQ